MLHKKAVPLRTIKVALIQPQQKMKSRRFVNCSLTSWADKIPSQKIIVSGLLKVSTAAAAKLLVNVALPWKNWGRLMAGKNVCKAKSSKIKALK